MKLKSATFLVNRVAVSGAHTRSRKRHTMATDGNRRHLSMRTKANIQFPYKEPRYRSALTHEFAQNENEVKEINIIVRERGTITTTRTHTLDNNNNNNK